MALAESNARAPRILVVDDEAQIRTLVRRCLSRAGFDVLQAAGVDAAIGILEHEAVDLLMTDLKMPGGCGTRLIAWALAERPGLPIVCVSAYTDDVQLNVPVLAKPFDSVQLLAAVDAALARRAASPA